MYMSHCTFKKLLEVELGVPKHAGAGGEVCGSITWEEENALRYVAGYVCQKVQNKIAMSKVQKMIW